MICHDVRIKIHNILYFQNITYYRSALRSVQLVSPSRLPSIIKTVDYQLDYELTPLQNNISRQLLQRYHLTSQHFPLKRFVVLSKTEITYEVIKYALNQGKPESAFTTPRKELVIELAKRLQSQFKNISITTVYGGHSELQMGKTLFVLLISYIAIQYLLINFRRIGCFPLRK